MVEKIRAVQNPLTVIAIFAALAEIAGTVALATVDRDIQHTFVWFVMAFPACLVLFFFATLNFNPKVLYAPSDFKDEDNFLNTLAGGRAIAESFHGLTKQLEVAKQQILAETVEQVGAAGHTEREKLAAIVTEQLELLRERVELTRESAIETTLASAQAREVLRCDFCSLVQFRSANSLCRRCNKPLETDGATTSVTGGLYPRSELQAQILEYLLRHGTPLPMHDVCRKIGKDPLAIERALEKLARRGLAVISTSPDGVRHVAPLNLSSSSS